MRTQRLHPGRLATIVCAGLTIFSATSSRVQGGPLPYYAATFLHDLQNHVLDHAYRTSYATGDFNGDGFGDLAIGIPFATVAGQRAAGKVIINLGDHDGLTDHMEIFHQGADGRFRVPDTNEAGDLLGFSLAAGDFNGDGVADLAVGAPGQDLPDTNGTSQFIDAGAVFVAHGKRGLGLNFSDPGDRYTQDGSVRFDVAGDKYPGSLLGFSLAAGDFNGDGRSDLAVGLPGKGYLVGGTKEVRRNAGAVVVIAGTAVGLWGSGAAMHFANAEFAEWGKGNYNLAGSGHSNDCVGFSLAAGDFDNDGFDDLAIGAPGQNEDAGRDTGAVKAARGTENGLDARAFRSSYGASGGGRYNLAGPPQEDAVLGFSLAAGDFDGDGRDDLAVGVPGRNVQRDGLVRVNAGAVVVAAGSDVGPNGEPILDASLYPTEFTQSGDSDRYDLPGQASGQAFVGFSLAAGDFDFSTLSRRSDLAIGAPGVALASGTNHLESFAGAVFVRYGSDDGGLASAWPPMMLSQSGAEQEDLWDDAEEGDNVGMTVAAGPLGAGGVSDLMIAVPGERLENLTLGLPLEAPFDQMFVDAMTHVVYGQEGVGLDGRRERHPWFSRFTRGVQFDPTVVGRVFQYAMQLTQPIVSADWSLNYAPVELRFERSSNTELPDQLYSETHYWSHERLLGWPCGFDALCDVKGYGAFFPDQAGVLLVVNATYEHFGHRHAVVTMPDWVYDWGMPIQTILLPNYVVEAILER